MIKSLLFALSVLSIGLASSFSHADVMLKPYVVGGNDAGVSPSWMVQVFVGTRQCGGVLVAPEWVVTAAHCTYEAGLPGLSYAPSQVKVLIGEYQALDSRSELALSISSIYQHPDYIAPGPLGVTYDNDISLLRLTVPYSEEITYPHLNDTTVQEYFPVGINFTLIGFGRTNTNPLQPEYPDVLQEVYLPLLSRAACEDEWGEGRLSDNMFCTYAEQKDACSGDSGGPLFIDEGGSVRIVGLVSWGDNFCSTHPGVYTDLGHLCSWLADTAIAAGAGTIQCSDYAGNKSGGSSSVGLVLLLLLAWRIRR